ncbi:MAG: hypothetical protein Q9191_006296 [Dirinaria sp. TL-2023a]
MASASATRLSKPAAQINGPAPAGRKPREEIYAPGYLTDAKVRHSIMCALNPDIDTTPAVLGHKDPSKLQINLYHPPFGTAAMPLSLIYSEVNWHSDSEVRSLNRWRQTTFIHYLGPEIQGNQDLEKGFVAETTKVMQYHTVRNNRAKRKMARVPGGVDSWARVTEAFDMRFAKDHRLSGCGDIRASQSRSGNKANKLIRLCSLSRWTRTANIDSATELTTAQPSTIHFVEFGIGKKVSSSYKAESWLIWNSKACAYQDSDKLGDGCDKFASQYF